MISSTEFLLCSTKQGYKPWWHIISTNSLGSARTLLLLKRSNTADQMQWSTTYELSAVSTAVVHLKVKISCLFPLLRKGIGPELIQGQRKVRAI